MLTKNIQRLRCGIRRHLCIPHEVQQRGRYETNFVDDHWTIGSNGQDRDPSDEVWVNGQVLSATTVNALSEYVQQVLGNGFPVFERPTTTG